MPPMMSSHTPSTQRCTTHQRQYESSVWLGVGIIPGQVEQRGIKRPKNSTMLVVVKRLPEIVMPML
jgi:hypothetical protein